jgi:hypothetical protein
MALPIESTVTLLESIMNDVEHARWSPLPPKPPINEAMEGHGTSWRIVVIRWPHGSSFHYEGMAVSKMKHALKSRLPADLAEKAWARATRAHG